MALTFRVADEICAAFPDVKVVLVVAREVRGDQPWPQVETGLAGLEQAAATGTWSAPAADLLDLLKGHVGATSRHVLDAGNRWVEVGPCPE